MKKLLCGFLIAVATFVVVAAGAWADDDDDDDHDRGRKARCKILMVEVMDNTLVIDGAGLTKKGREPRVWFGGVELAVNSHTPEHIEADLGSTNLTVTKGYLLEVKRSRKDDRCPSHFVSVVSQGTGGVSCPSQCVSNIDNLATIISSEGASSNTVLCGFDSNLSAGFVTYNGISNQNVTVLVLVVDENQCDTNIGGTQTDVSVTDAQQAACAEIAKTTLVNLGVTTAENCNISPP